MAPDVNSLPPSPVGSGPLAGSPASLHATAATNAGRQQRGPTASRAEGTSERRRSSLITNLNLQDAERAGSTSPILLSSSQPRSPLMNTADPHHQRTPSLGQIHQQLENEQEAQVNRLLSMIRVQQDQLAALQAERPSAVTTDGASEAGTVREAQQATGSPASGSARRATSIAAESRSPLLGAASHPTRSPLQRPTTMSRQSSRGNQVPSSIASSPSLRPLSSTRSQDEWSMGGVRDDSSFYQAETQLLQRENQMLKMRIRELERQVADGGRAGEAARSSTEPT